MEWPWYRANTLLEMGIDQIKPWMVERPGNVAGNKYSMYMNNCHSKEIRIIHKKTTSKVVQF